MYKIKRMKGLAMSKAEIPIVKRSLFSWIFAGNLKLQLLLLLIIVVMVMIRVLPLEMQKRIVNEAINLRSIDKLVLYSGYYLGAVFFFSVLKYLTNIIQTLITQRTTARMRKDLYHHILTLPLNFFRKTQPGTVVNALSTEFTRLWFFWCRCFKKASTRPINSGWMQPENSPPESRNPSPEFMKSTAMALTTSRIANMTLWWTDC